MHATIVKGKDYIVASDPAVRLLVKARKVNRRYFRGAREGAVTSANEAAPAFSDVRRARWSARGDRCVNSSHKISDSGPSNMPCGLRFQADIRRRRLVVA
jgi:hypothetical protein